MSLDSRLFRPSRSNSNSASSALVSVGVSSDGRLTRSRRRCSGRWSWLPRSLRCVQARSRAPNALRAPARRPPPRRPRCARRSAWPRSSSSSRRTARLRSPGAMPAAAAAGLVDVEQRRAARTSPVGSSRRRAISASWLTRRDSTKRQVAHARTAAAATGSNAGTGALEHGLEVELEQHRRLRQFVGLAPARVQFADDSRCTWPSSSTLRRCARGAAPDAAPARSGPAAAPAAPRRRP